MVFWFTRDMSPAELEKMEKEYLIHLENKKLKAIQEQTEAMRELKMLLNQQLASQTTPHEETKGRKLPGRPRMPDDLWAIEEVKMGRDRSKVEHDWMLREGVKARNLVDPHSHFNRLFRPQKTKKTK